MIDFASSPQSTLGVEWEIALIDRESGELTQRAAEVLGILRECLGNLRVDDYRNFIYGRIFRKIRDIFS